MELTLVKEHPDGSATYTFDMTDDERLQLLNLGIITALKNGIEEGKKYEPREHTSGTEGTAELQS